MSAHRIHTFAQYVHVTRRWNEIQVFGEPRTPVIHRGQPANQRITDHQFLK
jgi:hypothetical protein